MKTTAMQNRSLCLIGLLVATVINTLSYAENIDPDNDGSQYGYGENVGWFNLEPALGGGVQVSTTDVTGYVWQENVGWINLSPAEFGGVLNDGLGNLSGYAWGENIGWVNFDPDFGGVVIGEDGLFDGWAWGENVGWILFDAASSWDAQVAIQGFKELTDFGTDWLGSSNSKYDYDGDGYVDLNDWRIFAEHWMSYSP